MYFGEVTGDFAAINRCVFSRSCSDVYTQAHGTAARANILKRARNSPRGSRTEWTTNITVGVLKFKAPHSRDISFVNGTDYGKVYTHRNPVHIIAV